MTPGLYASQYRDEEQASPREKSARGFEVAALMSATRLARLAGACVTAIGFGMLFLT